MFVPSLLSAFHKHSHRQVLLAQTAAESSFQSCTSKYLGKLNIKFALCKYSCQACRGVQTVRHRNNIAGRIKAHQGKLFIQAIAFEVTDILSPQYVSHIKVTATLRLCHKQEEAADVREICCIISSAVTER